ncbi:phospho-2-dehydro-3-deoxyheptonate aldolase [Escherichia coli]|uniref:Phospho-2-dehydro-3-deoxyheptonate aldolase n=1 Tax=Escherichia coli TaxID=562 RepID=A0A2X1KFC9_ECOLX|nr:phospho-2-dehydro-3-deoxyheptonate aldolase [Escherichia coli]
MAESFLREGTQKIVGGQPLTYGQSITDPCLGWEDTEPPGRKTRLCGRYPLLNACPFLMGWAFLRNLLSSQHITACSGLP